MFLILEQRLRETVARHIAERYQVEVPVVVELPRQPDFGELALPVCFTLAKALKRPPRKIAEEMVAELPSIPGIRLLEVAGAGYINVRFDRAAYVDVLRDRVVVTFAPPPGKVIVEHTNINPNKAAHIGHLRNSILGDTLVRMLRELGHEVEAQNYIDNTGVQVADVVAGFHFLEKKTPADVKRLIEDPAVRFDYYCWDLYAKTSQYYAVEPSSLPWRAQTLHAIEAGEGDLAEIGRAVADAIVDKHLDTMQRIDVEYDVLPRESEILHLQFWASAFELLKQREAIFLETAGKNKGCWVMPAHLFQQKQQEEPTVEEGDATENAPADDSKVIVRSDGTVTYVGKDIAYQLWKFGLIDKDFHYAPLRDYADGRTLWVSSTKPGDRPAPKFGGGTKVFNVIDVRQSYLQDVVRAGLRSLGYEQQSNDSVHFSYEMVALTPRCCAELGIELSEEDRRRPYVEVSGRRGLGVKADDLIDLLTAKAFEEVRSRHPEGSEARQTEIATQIAIGALRYFMLRFTRTTVIAFDLQEALSFEGETGPYVQYAVVRARNILRKLEERGEAMPDFTSELTPEIVQKQIEIEDFWQILLGASRCDWTVEKSIEGGEPAHLARYAFQIAQAFNNFYHQHHILSETEREKKVFLLWMTQFFLDELTHVLSVMGIPSPEVM
ncbi:MAG: arginine--tRNA ligase [Bryobacterales bacterium]